MVDLPLSPEPSQLVVVPVLAGETR